MATGSGASSSRRGSISPPSSAPGQPVTKRRWRTAVFDHASEAIFVVDEKLRVVDANQAACDLWATGYEDLLGGQLAGLEHALFGRMGDSTITVDHSFVRPDGTPVLTELRAVPRYMDGLHLLVFRDIAESRSTEQRLRMMSRALSETADLVLITDRDGVIVYVNAAWEALTGYSSSEVLGSTPAILRSGQHQDAFYADLWATIARGEVFRGELLNVAKDGSTFLEEKIITSLRDPSGQITHYVSIGRPIEERRRIEARLREVQRLEAIGQLAGGIAHDFNNLLTVIQANVSVALDELDRNSPVAADLQDTLRAAKRAAVLTRQLLAFSRKQVLEPSVFDLNHIVQDLERSLLRLLGADIELSLSLTPGLSFIKVDRGQIEQVIVNLAVNARDAMPQGGKLRITTENATLDECAAAAIAVPAGSYVRLLVEDTGTGMTRETLTRIFEPFFTTKPRGYGTGLGLATVFGIMTQSGGGVRVESSVGVGSRFEVVLPSTSERPRRPKSANFSLTAAEQTSVVLLVEDEPTVLRSARRVLTKLGYTVLEASNAQVALEVSANTTSRIDLLLTDVVLPKVNGRELAEQLRALRPGTKVLFMSGYAGDVLSGRNSLPPGTPLLHKPFTPETLAARVREVLFTEDA